MRNLPFTLVILSALVTIAGIILAGLWLVFSFLPY